MLESLRMDIDALHSALLSLTVLTEQIRSARDNVSAAADPGPQAFEEFLNSVERDLLITKATLARELDFPVCQCCWPPELFVIDVNGNAYCPGSRKAAAINGLSSKPPQRARLLRVISKPPRGDTFEGAQTNELLQPREGQEARPSLGLRAPSLAEGLSTLEASPALERMVSAR